MFFMCVIMSMHVFQETLDLYHIYYMMCGLLSIQFISVCYYVLTTPREDLYEE